jgi:hypothetical protein
LIETTSCPFTHIREPIPCSSNNSIRLPKRLLDLPQGVIGLGWFAAAISLEGRAC